MSLGNPTQLIILQRLTTLLQGITPDNGYDDDLSQAVFRGRSVFGDNDPMPMVSILESAKPNDPMYVGDYNRVMLDNRWLILLQGWVADDKANPTDPAYLLKAQVQMRLGEVTSVGPHGKGLNPELFMLGGLINGLRYGIGTCRPPEHGISSKAYFYLPLEIELALPVAKPYLTVG